MISLSAQSMICVEQNNKTSAVITRRMNVDVEGKIC